MSMQTVMAALALSDIRAASAWFAKLLGRGPSEAEIISAFLPGADDLGP